MKRTVDMSPTPEFQQAFKKVVELDCTPVNLNTVIREHPALYEEVLREHIRILERKAV